MKKWERKRKKGGKFLFPFSRPAIFSRSFHFRVFRLGLWKQRLKMEADLNLLTSGLSAVLGTDVVLRNAARSDDRDEENSRLYCKMIVDDLFRQTHIMRPTNLLMLMAGPSEMFDLYVRRVSGKTQSIRVSGNHTIQETKAEIERTEGTKKEEMILVYSGEELDDTRTVGDYGIRPEETIFLVPCLPYGGRSLTYVFDTSDLDLKVLGKYENDAWLGSDGMRTEGDPGEWPVSYHGTNSTSAKLIVKQGYKPGPRELFGKGIYTSPSLEMVERLYAQEFTHDGKTYKIALQNRVNPDQKNGRLKIIPASETGRGADYWLSPGSHKNDVRPYGILIREVIEDTSCILV